MLWSENQASTEWETPAGPHPDGVYKRHKTSIIMFAMQRMQRAAAPAMRTARRNMSGHSAEEAKAETLAWKKYSASTCLAFYLYNCV